MWFTPLRLNRLYFFFFSFHRSLKRTRLSIQLMNNVQRTRQIISIWPEISWTIGSVFCPDVGRSDEMEIRSMTSTYNIFDIESDRCPWWSSLRLIRDRGRFESELNSIFRGASKFFHGPILQILKFSSCFHTEFWNSPNTCFLDFKLPLLNLLIVEFSTSTEVLDVHVSSYIG